MTDPSTTAADTTTAASDETPVTAPLTAESLIEEVSIDGMCGVY